MSQRKIKLTENQIALELMTGLGGCININGIDIPPITTATISMLVSINSPFLAESENNIKEFSGKDILDVLYIAYKGREAVQGIYQAKRQIEQIERLQLATLNNSDNFSLMLDKMTSEVKAFETFDNSVFEFGETLGVFNIADAGDWIINQISIGLNGYDMIAGKPGQKELEKKNKLTYSTFIGLCPQLPLFLRCLIWIVKKLYLKCP